MLKDCRYEAKEAAQCIKSKSQEVWKKCQNYLSRLSSLIQKRILIVWIRSESETLLRRRRRSERNWTVVSKQIRGRGKRAETMMKSRNAEMIRSGSKNQANETCRWWECTHQITEWLREKGFVARDKLSWRDINSSRNAIKWRISNANVKRN